MTSMRSTIILTLTTAILLTGCNLQTNLDEGLLINPIIGDISFIDKFGVNPDHTTDENLRIKTHLEYVERLLRQRDVSNLPSDLQEKRKELLDLLHDYWMAENFPQNYDYPDQRKPCFIDKDGNICAVGYLVEKTAGREVTEEINSSFKYNEIYDMESPALIEWLANSGLTLKECAMIQPAYNPPPSYNNNYISTGYGLSSSILSGTNLALNTVNAVQISKGQSKNTVPIIGLLTGAGQIGLGIANLNTTQPNSIYYDTNESRKAVSLINICLGTSTIILSSYNLIANRKNKPAKVVTWNIYNYPTLDNQAGLGLELTRRF